MIDADVDGVEDDDSERAVNVDNAADGFFRVDDDDDFVESGPRRLPQQVPFPGGEPEADPTARNGTGAGNNKPKKIKRKSAPKIYFGTRFVLVWFFIKALESVPG